VIYVNSLTSGGAAGAQDVLLYGRNSTDDQAEAGTIQTQQHFLRNYAQLYGLRVVGQFWDEGVSGTVPIEERGEGRSLLEAARARPGAVVLCYRIDRLGRTLRTLLDAHDALEGANVTIRSATEPFDTGTAIGKFLFQLLASLAELDRANLLERMSRGRDRVVRAGRWVSGTIPFGYELGSDGALRPSTRLVEQAGMTEAEVVVDLFRRIAGGSSAASEAVRLNSLGITAGRNCANGGLRVKTGFWKPDRITKMIHKGLYAGTHVHRSRHGTEVVAVPPLVDEGLRAAAAARLGTNRRLATKNARRLYLLRGLVECARCEAAYCGATHAAKKIPYYFCNGGKAARKYGHRAPCDARMIRAEELEAAVWADVAAYLRNPGPALAEARRQLRARLAELPKLEAQRRRLTEALAEKAAERERVMTMYRRGRRALDETEDDLDQIQAEVAALREQLEKVRTAEELAEVAERQHADAAADAAELAANLDEVERSGDPTAKRAFIERLVRRVTIAPTGDGIARARVTYRFSPPAARVSSSHAFVKHEENPDAPQLALEWARDLADSAATATPREGAA
jgi:site-specific DNA recombinase